MATKLKHLKVTNVDFVDEGANPDAFIKLFKRKDDAAAEPEPGTARVLGIAAVVLRGHVREVSAGMLAVSCRKAVRIRHAAVVYPWRKIPACIDIHKSLIGKGSRQIHLRAVIIPYKVMDTMRSECKRGKDEPEH